MSDPKTASGPLMVFDVGNTNTVCGVYLGEELVLDLRLATHANRTADEYGAVLTTLFERQGLDPRATTGVVVSSVVPPLHQTFEVLSRCYFDCPALFVEPGVRTGMAIRYDTPGEVGADRIVNAVAARELFGAPVIVVDFGTATSFDVVGADGDYVGGIIAPGIGISAEALFSRASRLFRVDIQRPDRLIGRNTAGSMQSGIYYGYLALVDGILERLVGELGEVRTVAATGGYADLMGEASRFIQHVEPHLTLLGLRLIHELNR